MAEEMYIECVDPKKFSHGELLEVQEVIQDMFAETSHEFMLCQDCGNISGKADILGECPLDLYRQSVHKILSNTPSHIHLSCPDCHSDHLTLIHPIEAEVGKTRKRISDVIEIQSIVGKNTKGEIVGYGEVYGDTFHNAYTYELSQHYSGIAIEEMRRRIHTLIKRDPSTVVVLPFLGILAQYRSSRAYATFLKTFFTSVSFAHEHSPGLMEIARNGPVYKVFKGLGGISLNESDPEFFRRHLRASERYDSSILVFPESVSVFRDAFSKKSTRGILLGREEVL